MLYHLTIHSLRTLNIVPRYDIHEDRNDDRSLTLFTMFSQILSALLDRLSGRPYLQSTDTRIYGVFVTTLRRKPELSLTFQEDDLMWCIVQPRRILTTSFLIARASFFRCSSKLICRIYAYTEQVLYLQVTLSFDLIWMS